MDNSTKTDNSKQKILNVLQRPREKKWKSIRQRYVDFAESVSMIGLKELIQAGHWIVTTLWFIFMLFSVAVTIYFVYDVIKEYQDNPTATKIKFVKHPSYEFPPVYICLEHWKENAWHFTRLLFIESNVSIFMSYVYDLTEQEPRPKKQDVYLEHVLSFAHKENYSHMVDFLFSYIEEPSHVIHATSATIVEKVYLERMNRPCYKVSYPLLTIVDSKLRMGTKKIKVLPNMFRSPEISLQIFVGLDPRTVEESDMIMISASGVYEVVVNAKKAISVSTKDSPCEESLPLKEYSFEYCLMNCEKKLFLAMFGCTDQLQHSTPIFNEESFRIFCSSTEIDRFKLSINDSNDVNKVSIKEFDRCQSHCQPPPCEQLSYSFISTQSKTPRDKENDIDFVFNIKPEYLKTGVFTVEEKVTFTFASVVSNIGGQLSMWLGIGVVTLVQAGMYFLNLALKKDTTGGGIEITRTQHL